MKKIKLKGLHETIYYDKCSNGLKVYVWKSNEKKSFMGTITYRVGGEDIEYLVNNHDEQVPVGTHHYLEHMLCKRDDGEPISHSYQKYGSSSNAFTSEDQTTYLFYGTNHLQEHVSILLDSNQNKVIKSDIFEKERGPILEEARMRSDSVGNTCYYLMNQMLFHHYPNHLDLTGGVDNVKAITLDDLNKVYHSFYHPKNAFMVISGNVNPKKVIGWIKENQKEKVFEPLVKVKRKKYYEPKSIVNSYQETYQNVEIPSVLIKVKIPKNVFKGYSIIEVLNAIGLVLDANIDSTSLFHEELEKNKLVTSLGGSCSLYRDYYIISVYADTWKPNEVLEKLKDKLNHLEINDSDIQRKLHVCIANTILRFSSPQRVNNNIQHMIMRYGHILEDGKPDLEKLSTKKIKKIMNKVSMKEMCVLMVYPKNKKEEN